MIFQNLLALTSTLVGAFFLLGSMDMVGSSEVRITGGKDFLGVVQFYENGKWNSLCADGFGRKDANVVCRQLGFKNGMALNIGVGGHCQQVCDKERNHLTENILRVFQLYNLTTPGKSHKNGATANLSKVADLCHHEDLLPLLVLEKYPKELEAYYPSSPISKPSSIY
ncbi:L3BPA-like protein [Mya arenaria]|uniref:L3BPA-like protein n=1 Tax=Mya arenaria TaxID=6604 RepID=A0ABY7DNQ0_MYAAR|nr:L3BPA-like protein [Mya arenaria]